MEGMFESRPLQPVSLTLFVKNEPSIKSFTSPFPRQRYIW